MRPRRERVAQAPARRTQRRPERAPGHSPRSDTGPDPWIDVGATTDGEAPAVVHAAHGRGCVMPDQPHTCNEPALRQALVDAVTTVEPQPALPQVLAAAARRREAWLITLAATIGALLILAGLLLAWGHDQPAPPAPATSTRLMEA